MNTTTTHPDHFPDATKMVTARLEDDAWQLRIFGDHSANAELRLQRILASRRACNASGQNAEDADNIRAAIASEAKP